MFLKYLQYESSRQYGIHLFYKNPTLVAYVRTMSEHTVVSSRCVRTMSEHTVVSSRSLTN